MLTDNDKKRIAYYVAVISRAASCMTEHVRSAAKATTDADKRAEQDWAFCDEAIIEERCSSIMALLRIEEECPQDASGALIRPDGAE